MSVTCQTLCLIKSRLFSLMNILLLNYEFPPIGGGAANANLCLLKQYAGKKDLQIDVLTSAPKPGFFSVGLAILLLGVGVSLAGFILFGLITELAKMAPS